VYAYHSICIHSSLPYDLNKYDGRIQVGWSRAEQLAPDSQHVNAPDRSVEIREKILQHVMYVPDFLDPDAFEGSE